MIKTIRTLLILSVLSYTAIAFSYDEPQYSKNFLLSVYFKAVELRDKAIMEINKVDTEIKKNEEAIQKAEKIISLAQQKGNAKAEMIAREALMKAQEAKRENEETRKQLELQKIRADRSYATIQNMLSQKYDSPQQIRGFVTNYTGNIYIIKANGERVTPENGFLEPGDKVWTGDGTAEMQILDGRATAKIGPYSEFEMKKDTPEEQAVELLKGKVYMAVDKIDEYAKKMKEKIEEYQGDLQTIKDINEEDIQYLRHQFTIFMKLISQEGCRNNRCPTAICGIRGTKLTSEIKEDKAMEITVLEGEVEVNIPELNQTISLTEGNRAIITKDGVVKQEKIENPERWWEK
jgi:ferric-dicitrate binding protein FerR (iron transport regulator)